MDTSANEEFLAFSLKYANIIKNESPCSSQLDMETDNKDITFAIVDAIKQNNLRKSLNGYIPGKTIAGFENIISDVNAYSKGYHSEQNSDKFNRSDSHDGTLQKCGNTNNILPRDTISFYRNEASKLDAHLTAIKHFNPNQFPNSHQDLYQSRMDYRRKKRNTSSSSVSYLSNSSKSVNRLSMSSLESSNRTSTGAFFGDFEVKRFDSSNILTKCLHSSFFKPYIVILVVVLIIVIICVILTPIAWKIAQDSQSSNGGGSENGYTSSIISSEEISNSSNLLAKDFTHPVNLSVTRSIVSQNSNYFTNSTITTQQNVVASTLDFNESVTLIDITTEYPQKIPSKSNNGTLYAEVSHTFAVTHTPHTVNQYKENNLSTHSNKTITKSFQISTFENPSQFTTNEMTLDIFNSTNTYSNFSNFPNIEINMSSSIIETQQNEIPKYKNNSISTSSSTIGIILPKYTTSTQKPIMDINSYFSTDWLNMSRRTTNHISDTSKSSLSPSIDIDERLTSQQEKISERISENIYKMTETSLKSISVNTTSTSQPFINNQLEYRFSSNKTYVDNENDTTQDVINTN